MNELLEVLAAEAKQRDDGTAEFTLTNTSSIIRVEAITNGVYATASEAFAAAQELATKLLAAHDTPEPVNAADLGAQVDYLDEIETGSQWRGMVNLRLKFAGENHIPISGLLE